MSKYATHGSFTTLHFVILSLFSETSFCGENERDCKMFNSSISNQHWGWYAAWILALKWHTGISVNLLGCQCTPDPLLAFVEGTLPVVACSSETTCNSISLYAPWEWTTYDFITSRNTVFLKEGWAARNWNLITAQRMMRYMYLILVYSVSTARAGVDPGGWIGWLATPIFGVI